MDKLTFDIVGAAMEVHSVLGKGYVEYVYQDALAHELGLRNIPFEKEKYLNIVYKDKILEHFYKADFVCGDKEIILELKAVKELSDEHYKQILNYLKGTGIKRGLLLNFGSDSLEYRPVIAKETYH